MNCLNNYYLIFGAISIIIIASFSLIFFKMKVGFGFYNLKVFGIIFIVSILAILSISEIEKDKLILIFNVGSITIGYLFGISSKNDEK